MLLALLSLSAASCGGTKACKDGTLFVAVSLDAAAAMADKLVVSVTVGAGTATTTQLDHPSGQSAGSVEIDFPRGYPSGQSVTVAVSATRAGAPVGSGSTSVTLGDGCQALSISVSGSGGGTGGGSGSGGQTGSGGTTVSNDGGLDGSGSGGRDGGLGTGGLGAGGSIGLGGSGAGGTGAGIGAGGSLGIGGTGVGGMIGVGGFTGTGLGGFIGGGVGGRIGIGGMTGFGGVTGSGGIMVGCPLGQSLCAGICYTTATDRAHCGPSCAACSAAEVCASSCVAAAAPAFTRVPPDPAGWQDPSGAALSITVRSTGYSNAIYECRTGPDASFTASSPPWVNCDGTTTGTGLNHTPTPNPTTPEGNYRTEHRYRADTYLSPVIAVRYYVHHNLDRIAFCPRAAVPTDGPHFTDPDYFAAAQTFATTSPALFPTAGVFPAQSAIPVRTDAIYLRNPFIKIPFTNVIQTSGMATSFPTGAPEAWPTTGGNYVFNERSLRHAWSVNAARTMVLLKRRYVSPGNSCVQQFRAGHGPSGDYIPHWLNCEALVLNTRGQGLCFNTSGTVMVPVAMESPPNGAGAVSATLNGTVVTGTGTNFAGTTNQFIQIPSGAGRWYRIASVSTATSITITPPYVNPSAASLPYRISSANTLVIPAAFAKMNTDAHNYATGVTAPKTPSPRTKCETLGCNTGKPWLTYLPP